MRLRVLFVTTFVCVVMVCAEGSNLGLDVPFVKQQGRGCGAAAISMVLQYWSRNDVNVEPSASDPEKIMQLLFSQKAGGVFASDMQKYFEDHGFRVFVFHGARSDLENHLQKGRPLIVCLNENTLHYVVVAGIDADRNILFINDPAGKKLMQIDWAEFEKRWGVMHNWTLLAVPGKLK